MLYTIYIEVILYLWFVLFPVASSVFPRSVFKKVSQFCNLLFLPMFLFPIQFNFVMLFIIIISSSTEELYDY
jgi:hypothetical protein